MEAPSKQLNIGDFGLKNTQKHSKTLKNTQKHSKTLPICPKQLQSHPRGHRDYYKPPNLAKNTRLFLAVTKQLGAIAELLAVLWSINDVCEAQKMCFSDAKTAFTMGFEIFKRSYLKIFIQSKWSCCLGDQSCSRHIGSMFEYV